MRPVTPSGGPRRVRLVLLASVAAGASLALAGELAFLALRGSPAQTTAAVPVIAVVVGAAGLLIAAVLARNEETVRRHAERVQLIGDPGIDTLDDDALLATLAARLRDAMKADQVVVLLTPGAITGARGGGLSEGTPGAFEVVVSVPAGPFHMGPVVVPATSYPADASAGVQCPPRSLPKGWVPAAMAVTQPVTGEGVGVTEGMVYVGWAKGRPVRDEDLDVVALAAGRVWSVVHRRRLVDAEHQARVSVEIAARRLRRMTEAAITLAGTQEPERLLGAAAAEARRVVQGAAALVVHHPVDQPERRETSGSIDGDGLAAVAQAATASAAPVSRDGCLAVPLLDRHQACRGALAVAAAPGSSLGPDDEAALVSLAHLVSLVVGRAELTAAVAVREARLNALVDAAPLAIVRLSPQGEVLEGNPAARHLFGWTAGALTGPLPEPLAGALLELAAAAARGDATEDAEVQGVLPQGEPLDLSVAAAPVRDEGGRVEAVLLVVADVSERRRAERQLEQAQRLEAMGQVAGGVAHDFNNLLTVIVGYTEALLAAADADDPARPLLESIERAGASAAALTRQLLGLAGRRSVEPVPVEPERLVSVLEPVVSRLVGVDVEVVLEATPGGVVVIDPSELEQVVLNLVINARDAMPDGGCLGVSVTPVELGPSEAEEHRVRPGAHVRLSVTDTGTGMDDETAARCFEPFFTRKERGRGTGLGLAAVYAVVTEAGGAVEVSSRKGVGTTFQIWLPCTLQRAAPPAVPHDEVRPSGTGRVLLVEDEEEIRELAAQALADSGFDVVTAADAATAVAAFEEASVPFDVLVTDIVMPGMRGTELAERLRQRQPSLEVLFVSGYTGAGPRAGEMINGVGVLRKPFRSHELCGRVVRLADRARSSA